MATATPRRLAPVLVVTLLALLLVLSPSSPVLDRAEAATSATTSSSHPYGDPSWFPLRDSASIGCAKSGCHTSADHGYWALDFIGQKGDPVYAAGAGVAHIGGNSGGCAKGSNDSRDGRWVWIDHGAGVVTRYHHLDSIAIKDGQLVTPATRIGAMGSSGDNAPCTTYYLHFEVRHGGLTGTRVDPGQLRACSGSEQISLPQALGSSSWDDPHLHPVRRFSSPTVSSSCIRPDWLATPAGVNPSISRANHTVTVSVPAPAAGTSAWMVRFETYHPSTKAWGSTVYRGVSASARSTVFTGLENARGYRAYVAVQNANGWSTWSRRLDAVSAPAAPSIRYLTWPKKDYVHYGWNRPENYGSAVTSFTVARRCGKSSGSYGAWKSYTQGTKDTYRNVRGLSSYKVCEIKVRATNAIGAGAWSTTRTVKR